MKKILAVAAAHLALLSPLSFAAFVPAPCDAVTGGGSLLDDQGAKANFSVEAGCRAGRLVGQLSYRDPSNGLHFESTAITAWLTDPRHPEIREICGIGQVAGQPEPVVFRARVVDNADPGRVDQFGIVIEDYRLMPREVRNPGGGNVQLHRGDGTTLPPIDVDFACGGLDSP